MLISRMARSGFRLLAFSTASRPFKASPTTVQPRRARRSPRMPRRTSSWSSATRIRSLFVALVICRYRHAHRGAVSAGFNIELTAYKGDSLVHAGDADPTSKEHFPGSGNSAAFVDYFQRELSGATPNSYLGSLTSRMPVNIRETFLNDPEKAQLDIWLHPSETRRYLQFNFDSSPLREATRVVTNGILKSGFIQHRRVQ